MMDKQQFEQQLQRSDALRLQGKWNDAQTILNDLHTIAEQFGIAAQAKVCLQFGRVLTDEGMFAGRDRWEACHSALQQAYTLAKEANVPHLLGDVHDALGMYTHVQYLAGDRSKEPPEELAHFEQGLTLRKQGGTAVQIAESLFHIGLVYDVIRRDYDQAAPYHQQAYEMSLEAGDKVIASYAIRHLGFTHFAADDLASAKAALEESLRLREEAGFVPGAAFAIIALAHWHMRSGDNEGALTKLQQAREMLITLNATARVEWVDGHIATLTDSLSTNEG